MAVSRTLSNFKGFTFAGVSSKNFGVYITGETVFNAPIKDVEMIEIPRRNGAYALDHGRFDNIELKYKASIVADTEDDFMVAVSDLRNYLCSRVGYQRLEDEYNPDEYRMAVYKSGLDVSPNLLKMGSFDIVFDCKPQRFLKSGENEQAPVSGGNLMNPTFFASSPLIMLQGYGSLDIGGEEIRVDRVEVGNLLLSNGVQLRDTSTGTLANEVTIGVVEFDPAKLNTGDTITLQPTDFTYVVTVNNPSLLDHVEANILNQSGAGESSASVLSKASASFTTSFASIPLTVGTSGSVSHTCQYRFNQVSTYGGYSETTHPQVFTISYDGAGTITITAKHWYQAGCTVQTSGSTGDLTGYSSLLASGTIYIDLDIGEAYWLRSNTVISANYAVHLGAELPTLKEGSNTITYDNTLTNVKIVPRWWKV